MDGQALARATCSGCGVEQAASRMMFGTLGHQCWKCLVRAQIAEHRQPRAFPAALVVGAAIGLLLAILFL